MLRLCATSGCSGPRAFSRIARGFNTLANEYPDFDGHYEVQHHSAFVNQLVADGRLKLQPGDGSDVVFHDSCYLGRYNDIYDQPRSMIAKTTGKQPLEAERKRYENGLSTSFEVLQIQEDLTEALSREVSAITNYRRALNAFYFATGEILEQVGVELVDG